MNYRSPIGLIFRYGAAFGLKQILNESVALDIRPRADQVWDFVISDCRSNRAEDISIDCIQIKCRSAEL